MKRYDIITEADARALRHGLTVALARGGHVTPLAADTLRERRITLLRDGAGRRRAPGWRHRRRIARVAVGSDHTGVALQGADRDHLRGAGLAVRGIGTDTARPGRLSRHRRRGRAPGRATARPTRASSSTAPASDRRSPPTRWRRARGDVHRPDAGALRPRAQRRQRAGPRRHAADRPTDAGHRRHLAGDADDRGALHAPAREDPGAGARRDE